MSPPHKKSRLSPKGNTVINWGFQTLSHEAFNHLADIFLLKNQKLVSDFLITNHLTGRGLVYWFMDDGGRLDYNKNSKNNSIVLNTHSFTNLEVFKLAKELESKFNLKIEVRSKKNEKSISYKI